MGFEPTTYSVGVPSATALTAELTFHRIGGL